MTDELYHYGIKGMKWGIRRTPAQLGHKTKTVAKRVSKSVGKVIASQRKRMAESRAHKEETKRINRNKKKKLSDLTNDELRERIARLELENRYKQLTPQHTSAGKQFLSTVSNQVIKPAATNAARQYLEKQLKKALGLNDTKDDPLKDLREAADRATLQNRKETAEEAIRNRAKRAAEEAASNRSSDSGSSTNKASSGTSKRSGSDSFDNVIEVTDFTVENVPPTTVNVGRVYTQNVLGGKSVAGLLPSGDRDRYR